MSPTHSTATTGRPRPARPYLVIIRAGSNALHFDWSLPADRKWDLVTLAYDPRVLENAGVGQRTFGDALIDSSGSPSKFHGLSRFFAERPETEDYRAVMMPDDDLLFEPARINELFEVFTASGAAVGQPALTPDSFVSHLVTVQHHAFSYRYTNFVEVMTPMMDAWALREFLPTFTINKSSWGMDLLWAKRCADAGRRQVIIDQTPVKHTRPVGGGGLYAALGVDPHAEMTELMAQHAIPPFQGMVLGGKLAAGYPRPWSGLLIESFLRGADRFSTEHPSFKKMLKASLPHLLTRPEEDPSAR